MAPPLHRAVSHDFGFEIEGKQTEALVSGVKSYMQWKDLSYTVTLDNGKQRRLLHKTFGYVRPGIMCALMGASGAGKSTLLDVLAGKKTSGNIEGEMLVNGKPKDETFTRIAGYVEQFDSHNAMSTVQEAIAFSGRMRLATESQQRRAADEGEECAGGAGPGASGRRHHRQPWHGRSQPGDPQEGHHRRGAHRRAVPSSSSTSPPPAWTRPAPTP